jgi:hypothetical protein
MRRRLSVVEDIRCKDILTLSGSIDRASGSCSALAEILEINFGIDALLLEDFSSDLAPIIKTEIRRVLLTDQKCADLTV